MVQRPDRASGEFRTVYQTYGTLPGRFEIAEVEHPSGGSYEHYRLVVADGRPGVVVVATRGARLLLVRLRRESVGAELWEFPRGSSEVEDADAGPRAGAEGAAERGTSVEHGGDYSDETLIRAGLRELREETGYVGRAPRVIGRYFADTSVFPQRLGVVRCEIDADAEPGATDGETLESRWFDRVELARMVREGRLLDSHTLAALTLLDAASRTA